MKSVFSMIVVFIGVYIVIYFDIFGFFAQKWFLIVAFSAAVTMLLVALVVLGSPFKKKGG
ncbi:MAG: hypothetical protein NC218_05710 [Acetobacter sp.]|nr:hypothetical protein [Acetobacter sp.]